MVEDQERIARWQKFKSRLGFAALALVALVLFGGIVGAAVWRAYEGETYPPTPTIPPRVEPNYAYVSDITGHAESQVPGLDIALPLTPGGTIPAGRGSLVRVGDNAWLRLGFVVGTTLFLDANTEVELRQIADEAGQTSETIVQLNYGLILVDANLEDDLTLIVLAPTGAQAQVTEGVMGLIYEPSLQRFSVHCLEGQCTLQSRAGASQEIETGELSWVQGFSSPFAVQSASYELFHDLGDPGLVPTATPTEENTTPTASATVEKPSPTVVTLEPTLPLPTFTPRSSPTPRTVATATSTATLVPDDTVTGTPVGTATATEISPTGTPVSGTPTIAATATVTPTIDSTPTISATATTTMTATSTVTATSETTSTVPTAVVVNADWLNVRSGPGASYDNLTAVQGGTVLELTGFRNEQTTWVTIREPEGIEGWVNAFYLETDYPLDQLQVWEGSTPTPESP